MASVRVLAVILFGAAQIALSAMPLHAAYRQVATPMNGPVVETDNGPVRGFSADDVDQFLGIPYASAPEGDLRWRSPQPPEAWSEVLPAEQYGNRCPAAESSNGPRTETEDCLFINVQRPAGTNADVGVPVFVFIHGGGLINGSSNQADMTEIVAQTGVIGVTFNYRLGVLGFLAHPELTAEDGQSGNYGFLDQQAALRWVQTNIARFGGDPARVTLGGQSAGGWSVCAHLVSPQSAGLFSQAILQSASCPSQSQARADAAGTAIAESLGCSSASNAAECLRSVVVGPIIDFPYPGFPAPVHGTSFLPMAPSEAVTTGEFSQVPMLIGANRDEGRTFSAGNLGWTQDDYVAWVSETFNETADAVLERYPWPPDADEFTGAYLSGTIMTDTGLIAGIGGCPNRQLIQDFASHVPTYTYEFAHRTGPGLTPEPAGYEWGAGHAAELAYLFPSFDNGTPIAPTFNEAEQALATNMKMYWGSFVQSGEPGIQGQTPWPSYNAQGQVLSLRAGDDSVMISDAMLATEHMCAFWDFAAP